MLYKHITILFSFCILKVLTYYLKFESCDNNGWTCINNTKGVVNEVDFNCTSNYKKLNISDVFWKFDGVPSQVSHVTLQNCNFNLIVEEGYPENLKKLVIRNITQLNLQPSRCALFTLPANRFLTLTIENIKYIKTLRLHSIRGNYNEVNIRKCKFGTIKWYSFFLNTNLFNFTENEVHVIETSAIYVRANKIILSRNRFSLLKYGSFFKLSLDGENSFMLFKSNIIQSSEFWSLHMILPNNKNNVSHQSISFLNNKLSCSNSDWLQRIEGEGEFLSNKTSIENLDKFENRYILLSEDNICIDVPCQLSIRQYKKIYTKVKREMKGRRCKAKINVCGDKTESTKYSKKQNTVLLSKALMRLNAVFQYYPDRSTT